MIPTSEPQVILTCVCCSLKAEGGRFLGYTSLEEMQKNTGWFNFNVLYPDLTVKWLCPQCHKQVVAKIHSLVEMLGSPHVPLLSLLPYEERSALFDRMEQELS